MNNQEYTLVVANSYDGKVKVYNQNGYDSVWYGRNEHDRKVKLIKKGFRLVSVDKGVEYWEKIIILKKD